MLIPKSMLWVLLMSQFVMAVSGSSSFSNIIENNSFEQGESTPTSWSTYGGAKGGWTTNESHSGNHSVKITNTQKEKSGWHYKTVLVNNSKTVTFGGWSKSDKVTSDASTGYYILINFADGSQQWYTKFHNKGTHDWEKVERILTFDKSIASVKIYAVLYYGTGTVWFDDIYVIEGENDNDVDNEKPIITLNGTSTISLNVGETYTDAGASVTDNVDKNLQVVVGGDTVNTSIAGTYVITYNARDNSNNRAKEVKRTIIIKEDISVSSCKNILSNSNWKHFGETWGSKGIYNRIYRNENYFYVATKVKGSGSYESFATEIGKTYVVKAELLGADISRNEDFKANSYITISSKIPVKDGSNIIASSEYVGGGDKVVVQFTFVAIGATSYLAIRSDKNWQYASARELSVKKMGDDCSTTDTEKPVISLVGGSTVQIVQGSKYVEAGARAIDNKDGDISSRVVIDSSSLDTRILGVYHVLYNVQDSAGNRAEEISRIVKVFEKNHHYKESNDFQDKIVYDDISRWSYYDEPVEKGTPPRYCKRARPPIEEILGYVYDEKKKSNVLGIGSVYNCKSYALIKLPINSREKELNFDLRYRYEFFFKVVLDTKKGERVLYYTPTSQKTKHLTYDMDTKKPYYGFVLGSEYKDNNWHTFRRDLNRDLQSKEADNELLSVKAFYASGSGYLDNIFTAIGAETIAKTFVKAYLADNSMVEQITSKRMIEKLRGIDDDVKEYFRAITSYHEMMYFHDLKAMVIAISKGEEIKFYFSWNGKRWILEEVL